MPPLFLQIADSEEYRGGLAAVSRRKTKEERPLKRQLLNKTTFPKSLCDTHVVPWTETRMQGTAEKTRNGLQIGLALLSCCAENKADDLTSRLTVLMASLNRSMPSFPVG
ncbi:Hypothetical predicted protein [Podarcis lilfordi]|uniref:Uncharacterized protein n=1 Tax=Podarcis lilfordi TaxID=74358 RepID=A0AA35PDM0_9SAUR|nr:Hypothetical predicted protein [Podarcis lilfordi]